MINEKDGETMSDFNRYERKPGAAGTYVTAYVYTDEAGNNLYRKVRCKTQDPDQPKFFYFERWENIIWCGKGPSEEDVLAGVRIVPYRLAMWHSKPTVILCEGEKDADNVASLGFVTTTSPFGHANWPLSLTPCFKDKLVYVLYDVAHGGHNYPEMVAATLWGTAREIRICRFPDEARRPHEFDVTDYLAEVPSGENRRRDEVTRIRELLR